MRGITVLFADLIGIFDSLSDGVRTSFPITKRKRAYLQAQKVHAKKFSCQKKLFHRKALNKFRSD